MGKIKRVLCFTMSYHRYKMLRGCIRDIQNQTYKGHVHAVNVTLDSDEDATPLRVVFDDLSRDNLHLDYTENRHNHWNSIAAIKLVPDYMYYDLYVKIDDDDMYKADYLAKIVDLFENNEVDICSTKIKYYLKDTKLIVNKALYNNFGGNPPDTDYNMPFTFAFNNRAFRSILALKHPRIPDRLVHGHDRIWRYKWQEDGLKHVGLDNTQNVIWYVHGANISTSGFLKK